MFSFILFWLGWFNFFLLNFVISDSSPFPSCLTDIVWKVLTCIIWNIECLSPVKHNISTNIECLLPVKHSLSTKMCILKVLINLQRRSWVEPPSQVCRTKRNASHRNACPGSSPSLPCKWPLQAGQRELLWRQRFIIRCLSLKFTVSSFFLLPGNY